MREARDKIGFATAQAALQRAIIRLKVAEKRG
jgi:hypothetical protein